MKIGEKISVVYGGEEVTILYIRCLGKEYDDVIDVPEEFDRFITLGLRDEDGNDFELKLSEIEVRKFTDYLLDY